MCSAHHIYTQCLTLHENNTTHNQSHNSPWSPAAYYKSDNLRLLYFFANDSDTSIGPIYARNSVRLRSFELSSLPYCRQPYLVKIEIHRSQFKIITFNILIICIFQYNNEFAMWKIAHIIFDVLLYMIADCMCLTICLSHSHIMVNEQNIEYILTSYLDIIKFDSISDSSSSSAGSTACVRDLHIFSSS